MTDVRTTTDLVRGSGRARPRAVRELASAVLLLGLLAGIGGVLVVVNQLTQPGADVPVTVSTPEAMTDAVRLGEGLRIEPSSAGAVDLHVFELPAGLRALSEASTLAAGLLLAAGAVVLRRVLVDIADGRPFEVGVPRRIATLAVIVAALALVPLALDAAATSAVLDHAGLRGDTSPVRPAVLDLPVGMLLTAAVLGVLTRVFRHGQWLTDEVEGLV